MHYIGHCSRPAQFMTLENGAVKFSTGGANARCLNGRLVGDAERRFLAAGEKGPGLTYTRAWFPEAFHYLRSQGPVLSPLAQSGTTWSNEERAGGEVPTMAGPQTDQRGIQTLQPARRGG